MTTSVHPRPAVGIPPIQPYRLPTRPELPGNITDWKLDADRAVLLVHDMQQYFLRPLPAPMREQLVVNVGGVLDAARAEGVPVAYTAQQGMTNEERGLLADFWGPGMRATAADRAVVDGLRPRPGELVVTKWRYSAFFRSPLLAWMLEHGRDQMILCGVYGHVGVLTTAIEAFSHDIRTFLVADGIGDFSASHHRLTVRYAAERCANVLTADEVLR